MAHSRVWLALAYLTVLLALAGLLVHLLVWETTRPAPSAEGAGVVAAAPAPAALAGL